MNFEETIAYIQGNLFGISGGIILVLTIVGITMSFLKRAVFYADFNDLALTAGMFALPALVMVAGLMLAPGEYLIYIAGAVFAGLLLKVVVTTWKSNEGSFLENAVADSREDGYVIYLHRVLVPSVH